MIRSKNTFLPVSPSPPNHITPQGFPAKLCPIFALSAISCRVNTTVGELECSCLSAKLCHFWRPFNAESDTHPCGYFALYGPFLNRRDFRGRLWRRNLLVPFLFRVPCILNTVSL